MVAMLLSTMIVPLHWYNL